MGLVRRAGAILCVAACGGLPAFGEVLSLEIKRAAPAGAARFMGAGAGGLTATAAATSPVRGTLGYNNSSLLLNGKPVLPVMGEFHYSRYPANEWRDELLKMKAGGITVVATYVFWIHHEEVKGEFDWKGQKNLREFVTLCREVGLPVVVRMGPWCHGEVRNGGMPDWADAMPRKRSADAAFMAAVKPLYHEIAGQLKGLLWKEGGPVMGVQVDNEFSGAPEYLMALKKLAREEGIDVPLYIKTGWPAMRQPMPFGELMPLFGAYAEGFWDRTLDKMPGAYWRAFTFSTERIDTAIATDIFGQQQAGEEKSTLSYPYLTCELGGGMASSYHRRITIAPMDVVAVGLTKVGSGSNLPGYYMYHGGTNPDGKTTTVMQETQSRNMANDLPFKTYDFQAPLGEYGQVRESYHMLRHLHLFLEDYQETLAPMGATFPEITNAKGNTKDLRYAVRSDGASGFVFVNNYQRGSDMPAKPETQFRLKVGGATVAVPAAPFTVPANGAFILPFNLKLGAVTIASATVQPVCKVVDGNTITAVFAEIPGVPPQLTFAADSPAAETGKAPPGFARSLTFVRDGTTVNVLVAVPNLSIWRAALAGKERIVVTPPGESLTVDGSTLALSTLLPGASNHADFIIDVFPPLTGPLPSGVYGFPAGRMNMEFTPRRNSPFGGIQTSLVTRALTAPAFEQTQPAGPPREIKIGSHKVAEQPVDEDFAGAAPAVYRIKIPAEFTGPGKEKVILRLNYTGDVARVYAGQTLVTDNYYQSTPFDIGLWRLPANTSELTLKILPLAKSAPIYFSVAPDLKGKDAVGTLDSAEWVKETTLLLSAGK